MAVDRSAFLVVDEFERRMAEYCGAPFCVSTDSCTNALRLCFERWRQTCGNLAPKVWIPKRTYVGVVQAARLAGFMVGFVSLDWIGQYRIDRTPIVDAARWLRRDMYPHSEDLCGLWYCLSFQATKHLPIGRGGAILCETQEDADWFRMARFDGRDQSVSLFDQEEFGFGIHAYMDPPSAARGLWLMGGLADHNDPIPGEYPDLSKKRWA